MPAARKTASAVGDCRHRMRAIVNYFACLRSAAFGGDIVSCMDMARGGLGFRTNAYAVSAEVKIAVPYSPEAAGASAIFLAARIVNIRQMPERQMLPCGTIFLPGKNPPG